MDLTDFNCYGLAEDEVDVDEESMCRVDKK